MSDLFHEQIPFEFIARVFDTMSAAHWHTFQVLTKRHERLAELAPYLPWPSNIWVGVTIENRRFIQRADYCKCPRWCGSSRQNPYSARSKDWT
jgi:protein gp37